jgi:hypothetical protein
MMCRTCNTEVHRLLPSGAASEISSSLSWCVAWCIIEPGFYLARTDIASPLESSAGTRIVRERFQRFSQ